MAFSFSSEYLKSFISTDELKAVAGEAESAHRTLLGGTGAGSDFLGWVELPAVFDREEVKRIKETAERIKALCDVFVVIGIGGSYLGTRAAVEFVKGNYYNNQKKDTPDIYFIGNDISAPHMRDILELCKDRDVCVNVISKSGTTTEPAIAFRIFKDMLDKKYGADARRHIFATTSASKGTLRQESDKNGYESFIIPDNIGGRYSVLTPAGLLPIAVSGIDIEEMLLGAKAAYDKYLSGNVFDNECMKYAAVRNILLRKGKSVEILAANDPALVMTCEWWKQLFGESEGKDGRGLYPASAVYSTDLHSIGQFIQEGSRVMFETVINVTTGDEMTIPYEEDNSDALNYLAGKTIDYVNGKANIGTILAHTDGGVPNAVINLTSRSAFDFGYLVYFFEKACGISGYMLGVNPFNQPGVEAYKKNMFALLGKPGYEQEKKALEDRLSGI